MNEYKVVISDNNRNKINDNKYENIKELAAAVRRFISRLLYTIKNKDDLSPEGKLEIQLKRLDLWDKKYRNVETIQKIIMQISEYDLTVGQSFEFYQLIKYEDENEIDACSSGRTNRQINKGKQKKSKKQKKFNN